MFLALREMGHARLRYTLIGCIMALIAWLVFLLAGLTNGLQADNASSIQNMNTDYIVFRDQSKNQLSRSLLPESLLQTVKAKEGVTDVTPLGQMIISFKVERSNEQLDTTMLAIKPDSFLAPTIASGSLFTSSNLNDVVVDSSMEQHNVRLGDILHVQGTDLTLHVIGFTKNQTYSHMPVTFANLEIWRQIRFPIQSANQGLQQPISGIAVKGDNLTNPQLDGVEFASKNDVVAQLPGYKEESGTLNLVQGFLFVIAAFVMAVFFYVLTLQKTNQFGVLKVLGANTGFLMRDLIGQVFLLSLIGIVIGVLLTFGIVMILPAGIPFALQPLLIIIYSALLLCVAQLGSLLSLVRVARTDALIAIGRGD